MVNSGAESSKNHQNVKVNGIGSGDTEKKGGKVMPAQKATENVADNPKQDAAGLADYQLGDCVGKGAFGSVYRALNWNTGETVAIKQVKLADLPKNELRTIMLEIDLLKNLNHPNIVKYHGFVKSTDHLYIILEYCENGSLHTICKNFGKFPENLIAIYMSQVLHGLLYLHEQGVIHRDIKGANILTTKEGLVKLADFGVATKATGLHESSVVGTPYWMAPEIIELSGATTASDIWSLGCTVIELLDGKPPYHKLQPMPALFRIVNDDHPPLPESASPTVQDFLMQCFQKDPNLRVSAKKLLKHPWILNAKRAETVVPTQPTKYDEAVKTVQQWNLALKSPQGTVGRDSRDTSASPVPLKTDRLPKLTTPKPTAEASNAKPNPDLYRSPDTPSHDNWDDDFASSIDSSALQLPHLKPVDHFSGMLSFERLKSFAKTENYKGEEFSESNEATVRTSPKKSRIDPQETVRAQSPVKHKHSRKQSEKAMNVAQRIPSQPKTQILRASLKPQTQQPQRPRHLKRSSSMFREDGVEDYSDLIAEDDVALDKRLHRVLESQQNGSFSPKFAHVSDLKNGHRSGESSEMYRPHRRMGSRESGIGSPVKRSQSSLEIHKYAEKIEDEDFSDVFGNDDTLLPRPDSDSGSERDMLSLLNSKFSTNSWLGDEEDEDDPFAQLEENLDDMDLETKVARDRHVRLGSAVADLVSSLNTTQPDEILAELSDQLLRVLYESPDLKTVVISSHGLLPILEVLDKTQNRDVSLMLLKIINLIILDSGEIQETLCFVGGIPIITAFAHKRFPSETRLEAAAFVRQICQTSRQPWQTSTLPLQMFISCGGLNVLVEFLEEDYDAERDLVLIGVNGIWSVFELHGPTPKNDFCRIFCRSSALYPLSLVLHRVLAEQGELAELVEGRIANIFFIFSQAENYVKESVADRMILKTVLKDLKRMSPNHQVTMLKFVKNLSMVESNLDALQNSNAIEVLTDLLSSSMNQSHFRELSIQILNTMFNLCRLSKARQEDAALSGLIPLLQRIVRTDPPLKEFALPILCDMAHSGRVGRTFLWQNKGLEFYISLFADPYWQVTALDAILIWLQEETAKVEQHLLENTFHRAVAHCFVTSRADTFENLLEPLQKLLRLSPPIAASLGQADIFARTIAKLQNRKAVVRGNLLRIIRSICDSSEASHELVAKCGLLDAVKHLAEADPAILVRNMALELIRSVESISRGSIDSRYRSSRRTSASTMTPPPLYSSLSQPPTPQHGRPSSSGYFDVGADYSMSRPRSSNINSITPYRPTSREGFKVGSDGPSSSSGVAASSKSRLPRTNTPRANRSNIPSKRDESSASTPTSTVHPSVTPKSNVILNSRRRRPTTGTN